MDIKKVKEFIDLAREEGLSELKYETKDLKVSISFPLGQEVVTHRQAQLQPMPPTGSSQAEESSLRLPSRNTHSINSPFVGTLYLAPSPDRPNYVSVGDKVKKGQTLCILEAMKIMNEIESDVDGVIEEICEENESLVEFGQPLFRIRT